MTDDQKNRLKTAYSIILEVLFYSEFSPEYTYDLNVITCNLAKILFGGVNDVIEK